MFGAPGRAGRVLEDVLAQAALSKRVRFTLPPLFSDTKAFGDETPKLAANLDRQRGVLGDVLVHVALPILLASDQRLCEHNIISSLVISHRRVPPKPATVSFAHDSGQIASAAVSTPHLAAAVGVVNDQHVVAFQQVPADDHGPAHWAGRGLGGQGRFTFR